MWSKKHFKIPNCSLCSNPFLIEGYSPIQRYRTPYLLKCGHCSCEICLLQELHSNSQVKCKFCNEITPVTNPSVSANELENVFPINYFLLGIWNSKACNNSIEEDANIKYSKPKFVKNDKRRKVTCAECMESPAAGYCHKCQAPYCGDCFKVVHMSARAFRKHTFDSLTDAYINNVSSQKMLNCTIHTSNQLEFYCKPCNTAVCACCIVEDHKKHDLEILDKMDADFREEFVQSYMRAYKVMGMMNNSKKKVETLIRENGDSKHIKSANEAIVSFFIHMHGRLSVLQHEMHTKLSLADSTRQLEELMNILSENITNTENKLAFTRSVVKKDSTMQKPGTFLSLANNLKAIEDLPCHIVESQISYPPRFIIDEEAVSKIGHLCALDISSGDKYRLVKESELPAGYNIQPVSEMSPEEVWSIIMTPPSVEESPLPVENVANSERPASPTNSSSSKLSSDSNQLNFTAPIPIYSEKIAKDCILRVKVSHVTNPSDFYVQREYADYKLVEFQNSLRGNLYHSKPPVNLSKGTIYLARYDNDQLWYRVRIIDIIDDQYKVLYIDYGNTDTLSRSNFRLLPRNSYNMPTLAYRCKLNNCEPRYGTEWDTAAISRMVEIINGEICTMVVVNTTPKFYIVDLFKTTNYNSLSISEALMFLEHATIAKVPSVPKPAQESFVKPVMQHLPKQSIKMCDSFEIHVSRVYTPYNFYGQNLSFSKKLIKLSDELQKLYKNLANSQKYTVYHPKKDMHVAARFSADNKWYRGIILDLLEGKRLHIFFIDFGAEEFVEWENVKILNSKFYSLAPQAIKCALVDIKPLGDDWTKTVNEQFSSMIFDKTFRIIVESVDYPNVYVIMYESTKEADICINAILVQNKLAISTGENSTIAEFPKLSAQLPNQDNSQCEVDVLDSTPDQKILDPPEVSVEEMDKYVFKASNGTLRIHVKMKRIISPGKFYVTPKYLLNCLIWLEAQLTKFYENTMDPEYTDPMKWKKSEGKCAVKYESKWYRGTFIKKLDDSMIKVYLVDEGLEVTVDEQWIRLLHPKFEFLHDGVIECRLGGLIPALETWSKSSTTEFKEFISKNEDSLYISQLGQTDDITLPVELFLRVRNEPDPLAPNIDSWNSVNHHLRFSGFARADDRVNWDVDGNILNLSELNANNEQSDGEVPINNLFSMTPNISKQSSVACESESQNDLNLNECLSEIVNTETKEDELYKIIMPVKWIPSPPLEELSFIARASYVDSDCCIYVHDLHKSSQLLSDMSDALNAKYGPVPKPYDLTLEAGDICAAQYHLDKKWHRAQVLKVTRHPPESQLDDEYEVQFVDYGNVETNKPMEMRRISLFHDVPIQAIKCCFHTLEPIDPSGVWKPRHIEIIQYNVCDKSCQIQLAKIPGSDVYGIVKLILPNGQNYVTEMVKEGFARKKKKVTDKSVNENNKNQPEVVQECTKKTHLNTQSTITEVTSQEDQSHVSNDEIIKKNISKEVREVNQSKDLINEIKSSNVESTVKNETDLRKLPNAEILEGVQTILPDAETASEDDQNIRSDEEITSGDNHNTDSDIELSSDVDQNIHPDAEMTSELDQSTHPDLRVTSSDDHIINPEIEVTSEVDHVVHPDVEATVEDDIRQIFTSYNRDQYIHCGGSQAKDIIDENEQPKKEIVGSMQLAVEMGSDSPGETNREVNIKLGDDFTSDNRMNPVKSDEGASDTEYLEAAESNEEAVLQTLLQLEELKLKPKSVVRKNPARLFHWSKLLEELSEHCKPKPNYAELKIPEDVEALIVEVSAYLTPVLLVLHLIDVEENEFVIEKIEAFKKLSAELQAEALKQPFLEKPYLCKPCCVQFTDDNWYRGFVLKELPNNILQVQYVDYGNVEQVLASKVRKMKPEWLELEVFGLLCELYQVDFTDDKPVLEVMDALANTLQAKGDTYKAVVKGRSPLQVEIYSEAELAYNSMFESGLFLDV